MCLTEPLAGAGANAIGKLGDLVRVIGSDQQCRHQRRVALMPATGQPHEMKYDAFVGADAGAMGFVPHQRTVRMSHDRDNQCLEHVHLRARVMSGQGPTEFIPDKRLPVRAFAPEAQVDDDISLPGVKMTQAGQRGPTARPMIWGHLVRMSLPARVIRR